MTDEIQKDKRNDQWLLLTDRIMDTVDIVARQVTSGRWLLTIAAGVCLVHIAFSTDDKKQIMDVIKDIIIFYFVVRDNAPSIMGKPLIDSGAPKATVTQTTATIGEVKP